jgi:DNA-binding transcriptional LysR family regulator
MIRSLELMSSFHAMCECDTWSDVFSVTGKTRERAEWELDELELILGKKLIHRSPNGEVASSFSSRFFMPTDAGMKWYLLIGELLRGLGDASSPSFDKIARVALDAVGRRTFLTSTLVVVSFSLSGTMQNLKIFTNDFLSFYFLEPLLEELMQKHNSMTFSTFGSEKEHLSDFDIYFLPHELPLPNLSSELIIQSKLGLYAHPSYIEKHGVPKNLGEIESHTMVRNKACRVIQSLGMDKYKTINNYKPLFYKKSCIEFDTYLSMLRLCERGYGIMPGTEIGIRKICTTLQKLPLLEDEGDYSYFKFTLGWHEKHNSSQIVEDLKNGLHAFCN